MAELLRIDLGCGAVKQPGMVGVDLKPGPGIDCVVDLDREPLPFADGSVGHVFSSHCLEHLEDPRRTLKEISRVAVDGATVEFWLPYAWNNDAFLYEHRTFFNETHFVHLGLFADYWTDYLGKSWEVRELVFALEERALADVEAQGIDIQFALRYCTNVVREMGVFATIVASPPAERGEIRRSYAPDRRPEGRRPLLELKSQSLRARMRRAFSALLGT